MILLDLSKRSPSRQKMDPKSAKRFCPNATREYDNDFFNGLHFYILPTGISNSRQKIFANNIIKFGGLLDNEVSDKTTHIIVDESITINKLCQILKWLEMPHNIKAVKSMWLSNCIANGVYTESKSYELNTSVSCHGNCKTSANKTVTSKKEDIDELGFKMDSNKKTPEQASKIRYDSFMCATTSTQSACNFNKHITDKLEVLLEVYRNTQDHWRCLGYEKAIIAIKKHPKEITSWEEAKSITAIGERLADKIFEIIQSGKLRKIDEVCTNERIAAINLFTKVWGIGSSTAETLVQQGFLTLKDLQENANLTKSQRIGLKYFDELQLRMPRDEAWDIFQMVEMAVKSINPELKTVACGSYRRKRETCGDVDVLVTHPDGVSHKGLLPRIVHALHNTGLLTDDLISQEDNGTQKKYMGICKLPGVNRKHRRIDIIVVPHEEFACALVHFTGSAHFNRSIRLLASKKSMSLSEHCLKAGIVRHGTDKITGGYVLPTPTEESVFQHLELEYRQPWERDHFAVE